MKPAPSPIDYTTLALAEVRAALDAVALDAEATFGGLDVRQLNWRPDPTRWSVAQCLEHLLVSNTLMRRAAEDALNPARPRSLWQRLPVLPGVFGRLLIRSLTPGATRRFTAPPKAQPAESHLGADVVRRFVEQHRDVISWMQGLDERQAERAIMTSPFIRVVTYSVLDASRLVAAHNRRHVEQARRVTQSPGFPEPSKVS
jgi:hypothetical protein